MNNQRRSRIEQQDHPPTLQVGQVPGSPAESSRTKSGHYKILCWTKMLDPRSSLCSVISWAGKCAKSWGAWIQCILAAWGKTFLEGRSKCNLVAARGSHYRLSRPRTTQLYQSLDNTSSISYLHKQEIPHFLFAPWHRADTIGASPLGTALMDVWKLPSEYSQLCPRAFWGLGACSVHRGSQKCWRVAVAGSSPPLKTNETLWITVPASLPAQVRPLQGVLCTVSQRPQWVQVSVALHGALHRKACCLDLLSQPDSLPTSLKSLPGVSSQINHLHLNFLSWGLHLGG